MRKLMITARAGARITPLPAERIPETIAVNSARWPMEFVNSPVWRNPTSETLCFKKLNSLIAPTRGSARRFVRIRASGRSGIGVFGEPCCKLRARKRGNSPSNVMETSARSEGPRRLSREFSVGRYFSMPKLCQHGTREKRHGSKQGNTLPSPFSGNGGAPICGSMPFRTWRNGTEAVPYTCYPWPLN